MNVKMRKGLRVSSSFAFPITADTLSHIQNQRLVLVKPLVTPMFHRTPKTKNLNPPPTDTINNYIHIEDYNQNVQKKKQCPWWQIKHRSLP